MLLRISPITELINLAKTRHNSKIGFSAHFDLTFEGIFKSPFSILTSCIFSNRILHGRELVLIQLSIIALMVVDFLREGYKIRKVFA